MIVEHWLTYFDIYSYILYTASNRDFYVKMTVPLEPHETQSHMVLTKEVNIDAIEHPTEI